MEPEHERLAASGELSGFDWKLRVSSQGGRLVLQSGNDRGAGVSISSKPRALGFGPIEISYIGERPRRGVLVVGTTIPALRLVEVEGEDGQAIETAVAHAKQDLGVNVFLAICHVRPRRIVATTLLGDGVFMNLEWRARGFDAYD